MKLSRRNFLVAMAGIGAAVAMAGTSTAAACVQSTGSQAAAVLPNDDFVVTKKQCRIAREQREAAYALTATPVQRTLYAKDATIYTLARLSGVRLCAVGDRPALLFADNAAALEFVAGNKHMFAEGCYVVGRREWWVR